MPRVKTLKNQPNDSEANNGSSRDALHTREGAKDMKHRNKDLHCMTLDANLVHACC
jgi:hypothetical protein